MRARTMRGLLFTFTLVACFTHSVGLQAGEQQSAQVGTPVLRGFLPPNANALGYSLVDLATAWNAWAFGTPETVNPLLAGRCERSPLDSRIWFLPVSLGGEYTVTCYVPEGSFLVLIPGGYECSQLEGHGSTSAELTACVNEGFDLLNYVEVAFNGNTALDLRGQIVTSRFDVLPADNLAGPDPNPTTLKAYVMVLHPLARGTHTLRAYDEFSAFDFKAGTTYTIVVR